MTNNQWVILKKLYNAECAHAVDQFQTLINELKTKNLLGETVVVFTADHGELLGEHNRGGHPPEFWEDLICVPLLLRPPANDSLPVPESVSGQVRLLDVAPTIVDVVTVESPKQWTGESMLDIARENVKSIEYSFGAV